MSSHLWDVKRFGLTTLNDAAEAIHLARQAGLGWKASLRFCGYALENVRQSGGFRFGRYPLRSILGSAEKSKHRYATGRNAANYLQAGLNLLRQLNYAPVFEEKGVPADLKRIWKGVRLTGEWPVLADALEDYGVDEGFLIAELRSRGLAGAKM